MGNLLEVLEWDSTFFGYQVAKINARQISAEKLAEMISRADKLGTRLLYLFVDPADTVSVNSANLSGAKLVDQKITFHISIDESIAPVVDHHIKLFESAVPSEQLIKLALQSGSYSRYKIDPGFNNNEFEKLYLAWIENSVNKKIADYIFIYDEGGKELGFVTLKFRGNSGQIGLIAVDEDSRGKSIGSKLIAAVINQLIQKKITELDVATQIDNIDACNFYKKVGFSGDKTENIYHIWF